MQTVSSKQPVLVISLDGLAQDGLVLLSQFMDWPKQFSHLFRLKSSNEQPFVSVQSIWSEILAGQSWSILDCPGYQRPGSSLNECAVLSEDDLLYPACAGDIPSVVINMPLLKPRSEKRIWLADGSLPIQAMVSPERLAAMAPYNSYRARPFPSTATALVDLVETVKTCLDTEKQRLSCALHVIKNNNWQIAFIRITIFDMLAHLLGPDYLACTHRLLWTEIRSFLCELDQALASIFAMSTGSRKCIVSAFTHAKCKARLNLNQLLVRAGFCRLQERSQLSHRLKVVQAFQTRENGPCLPIVSLTDQFDSAATSAASPVSGTIYLNRQSRFRDGIVAGEDEATLLVAVQQYLESALSREFGKERYVFGIDGAASRLMDNSEQEGKLSNDQRRRGPELAVSIAGVDLHDTSNVTTIDHENHPRSTHDYHGFVWLSEAPQHRDQSIETIEVNRYLLGQPL